MKSPKLMKKKMRRTRMRLQKTFLAEYQTIRILKMRKRLKEIVVVKLRNLNIQALLIQFRLLDEISKNK
jgi:hypothetical protein